ncbi:MAG: AI-2E family transporter [Polyangiaceae bacterium]|nr:AI-2E family transporter [Polyangiaceae bacterium]
MSPRPREHHDESKKHHKEPPTRLGLSAIAVIAIIGAAYVAHPVWMGLVLGTTMGFTSEPLYRWLAPKLRYKRALAALITTIIGGLVTLFSIGLVSYIAITEIVEMVSDMRAPSAQDLIGPWGLKMLERMRISPEVFVAQINTALVSLSEKAAGGLASALTSMTSVLLTAVIAFFTMYYVLLEWSAIVRRLEHILPLEPRHTRALVHEFRSVGRSAFVGTMGTALVQGVLAGTGYAIAGVSQPMLWGTVTMLASFLPVVGTAVVWIPVSIAVAASGHTGYAIFLFLWGLLIVTAVSDYVIRPKLVGSKGQVHPLPLLVSLLGGVEMFGLMGVIVGPILMSLCLSVLRIYEHERVGGMPA